MTPNARVTALMVLCGYTLTACSSLGVDPHVDGANPLSISDSTLTKNPMPSLPAATISALNLSAADAARYQRNEIVGQYLHESDALCAEYLKQLTQVQRDYGLAFGSLTTLFGGMGAAFTRAAVVRPLSAAAGISSGERAEIDADVFIKQTSEVIISGIKNSRDRVYNSMVQVNFAKPITDWPLSVALADVENYHQRCSLHEGITEAAHAISAASETPDKAAQAANNDKTPNAPSGRSEGPNPASVSTTNAIIGAAKGAASSGNAQSVVNAITEAAKAAASPTSTPIDGINKPITQAQPQPAPAQAPAPITPPVPNPN